MSKLQKTDAIFNILSFIKENIQSVLGVTTFSCCSFFVYYFDNYLIEIISIISFLILLFLLGLLDYRNNSIKQDSIEENKIVIKKLINYSFIIISLSIVFISFTAIKHLGIDKVLTKKLVDRDIENLLKGDFNIDKSLFSFRDPYRIKVGFFFHSSEENNGILYKLTYDSHQIDIVEYAKEYSIGFNILLKNGRIVNQQNISVFKNNKYDSLNKENEIIISKKDLDHFKFFISNIKQNDIQKIEILIKSFKF